MKISTIIFSIVCPLALTPAAFAQTSAPAPAAAPSAASSSFGDEDIRKFATAAIALNKIQQDASIPQADRQPKMLAAVQQSGLDPEKFNAIAQAAQTDASLQQRVQAAIAATQSQQAPGQPQN